MRHLPVHTHTHTNTPEQKSGSWRRSSPPAQNKRRPQEGGCFQPVKAQHQTPPDATNHLRGPISTSKEPLESLLKSPLRLHARRDSSSPWSIIRLRAHAPVCASGDARAGGRASAAPVSRTQAAGAFERGGTWQPRQPRAAAGYLHTRGSGGVISRGSTLLCGRQVSGAPGAHKVALPKGDACSTPTCPAVGGR